MKNIVVVEPRKKAYVKRIDSIVDVMETLNQNSVQAFDRRLSNLDLIVPVNGLKDGLEPCRVTDDDSFIAGTFVVVASDDKGQIRGLTDDEIKESMNVFKYPEMIFCYQ